MRKLNNRVPVSELRAHEVLFLLDPRNQQAFFKTLADEKLQN